MLAREIFTDPEVMKTSTAFACQIAENDHDLHLFLNSLIEKDHEFKKDYGLQKVFSTELQDYIGLAGAIRSINKIPTLNNIPVEIVRYLKKIYIGNGYGNAIDTILSIEAEKKENVLLGTIFENHHASNHLAIKYGMIFKEKITKVYKHHKSNVNAYIRYPASLKNFNASFDIKKLLAMVEIS
jgi:hypothetical protein